jgi:hypothetical protein
MPQTFTPIHDDPLSIRTMKAATPFEGVLHELAEIHAAKNQDYAEPEDAFANFRLSTLAGIEPWVGAVVRMGDKYSRIAGFAKRGSLAVKEESIEDTLKDLAVYSLVALLLYREATSGGAEKPEPVLKCCDAGSCDSGCGEC